MRIVSFTGPKGSGKDTSADVLKEFKIASGSISFAGPLKKICSAVFGLHHNYFNDPVLKEKQLAEPIVLKSKHFRLIAQKMVEILDQDEFFYKPFSVSISGLDGVTINTPRELLQFIGTEFIRDRVHPDWHLQAAFSKKTLEALDEDGLYCVTDARFPNEFQFLAQRFAEDFRGFYVERPEAEKNLAASVHPSERQVIEVRKLLGEESVLKNNGTLDDLKKLLVNLQLGEAKETSKKKTKASKFKFSKAGKSDEGSF